MIARAGALLCSAAACTVLAGSGTALAQDALYDGGKARVKFSAKLRSLTEEVASAACRVDAKLGAGEAQEDLAVATEQFSKIVKGLRDGDTALGIPAPEKASDILRNLQAVSADWGPIEAEANTLLAGGRGAGMPVIAEKLKDLLERAIELTARTSGHYSNPQELLQTDALTLDFMARQEMFLSRMSRVMCALASGDPELGNVEELRETVDLFGRSLVALRDGFPAAGINPPRNDAVRASLDKSYQTWTGGKGVYDAVLAGAAVTPDMEAQALEMSKSLDHDLHNTITLHLISSPGQEGVYRVPLKAYVDSELSQWLTDPALIAAVKAQNAEHAALTQEDIDALDKQWRAEAKGAAGDLISTVMGRPLSKWLLEKQTGTASLVTEVFVMDDKGLNVGQSAVTSDYWQGDEAKWQETYGNGGGSMHVSEIEFDDSTGFYQTQASLPIFDPASGELIGAVTFGVSVQNLM
ncbi:hypothetical protein [Defluviimonas sp. WL0075]|uniref:NarX-like N-terminal domain-containing protein n=1 Tax=Albidovulum sediminicola TaxID=2984331 RepID=A0ABT2YYB2_9RHOB|nr:hypothetical protein [Defluviimonas sp. WL0075]MCV2863752.1 hypothetical protein [Defluviimonas sp. WL0075]